MIFKLPGIFKFSFSTPMQKNVHLSYVKTSINSHDHLRYIPLI